MILPPNFKILYHVVDVIVFLYDCLQSLEIRSNPKTGFEKSDVVPSDGIGSDGVIISEHLLRIFDLPNKRVDK